MCVKELQELQEELLSRSDTEHMKHKARRGRREIGIWKCNRATVKEAKLGLKIFANI